MFDLIWTKPTICSVCNAPYCWVLSFKFLELFCFLFHVTLDAVVVLALMHGQRQPMMESSSETLFRVQLGQSFWRCWNCIDLMLSMMMMMMMMMILPTSSPWIVTSHLGSLQQSPKQSTPLTPREKKTNVVSCDRANLQVIVVFSFNTLHFLPRWLFGSYKPLIILQAGMWLDAWSQDILHQIVYT